MRMFTKKQIEIMKDGGCIYATRDGSFFCFQMGRWENIKSYYFHHKKREWVWGSDNVMGKFAEGWTVISKEEVDRYLALLEVS